MMKPEKFFALTTLASIFLFLGPAFAVAVFDPLFVYHKALFIKEPGFIHSDRYQAAGFINSYLADPHSAYDKIIIGTSMSQNFELDEQQIPLTLSGGRAFELAAITEKALATGKVKSAIWEIYISYSDQNPNDTHPVSPLPLWLYNNTVLDDWRYFFNESVAKQSVNFALGKIKNRKPMQTLYHWTQTEEEMFKRFQSPENINKLRQDVKSASLPLHISPPNELQQISFPSVEQNLLPHLKANPQVHFDLYFPPVSYYEYIRKGNEGFWREMLMRRAVLNGVADLPNVRVFAFDLIDGIGNDITIYRDSEHYPAWVNAKMLQSIKNGEHIITIADWPRYSQSVAERVNTFTIDFTASP